MHNVAGRVKAKAGVARGYTGLQAGRDRLSRYASQTATRGVPVRTRCIQAEGRTHFKDETLSTMGCSPVHHCAPQAAAFVAAIELFGGIPPPL